MCHRAAIRISATVGALDLTDRCSRAQRVYQRAFRSLDLIRTLLCLPCRPASMTFPRLGLRLGLPPVKVRHGTIRACELLWRRTIRLAELALQLYFGPLATGKAHSKFAASFLLPFPFHSAPWGYGQRGRSIVTPIPAPTTPLTCWAVIRSGGTPASTQRSNAASALNWSVPRPPPLWLIRGIMNRRTKSCVRFPIAEETFS